MLRKRLHLQIYFAILASLVLTVVLTGLLWGLFGRDRLFEEVYDITGRLVNATLPSLAAPDTEQREAVRRLGEALEIDITLYSPQRRLIASHGRISPPPSPRAGRRGGWHRLGRGSQWVLELPDGRWFVADLGPRAARHPVLGLILFLGSVVLAVGLVAYPLVRRLTRRLERLQKGVERIGSGDLSVRVDVEGKDEIASLAHSFNVAAERIEKLVGAHRLLLANASHELRTPLARIRLGIEMMKSGIDPAREAALRADIGELEALIDEILLMSRLDAGASVDRTKFVDLVALAAEECARYDTCEVSGSAPEISGDEQLLRRMIRNVLENAQLHGRPPVRVEFSSDSGCLKMAVRDAGPGVAPAERERVFQPFFRSPGRQNVKGYGLGLPLVRQIAQAHGGTAEFLDPAANGAVIEVRLPAGARN